MFGHFEPVNHCCFSPDDSYLSTSSNDGTVKVSGKLVNMVSTASMYVGAEALDLALLSAFSFLKWPLQTSGRQSTWGACLQRATKTCSWSAAPGLQTANAWSVLPGTPFWWALWDVNIITLHWAEIYVIVCYWFSVGLFCLVLCTTRFTKPCLTMSSFRWGKREREVDLLATTCLYNHSDLICSLSRKQPKQISDVWTFFCLWFRCLT